ncbi:MAG: radical SAM-associated putative lipoprotein [Bacteroidaceae bacterium]|nr:radical SAM-associated putative lipoprotein [Bacteroidaceae bacterium]
MIKNFKAWYRIKWNYVLGLLLAQLGVSSCEDIFNGGGKEMYGCPSADFFLSISVKDDAGKPLVNQKVVIRQLDGNNQALESSYRPFGSDTVMTNEKGIYEGVLNQWYIGNLRAVVNEPVDDTLAPDSVNIEMKKIKKGDGAWYMGKYSGSADIKLKKKQ